MPIPDAFSGTEIIDAGGGPLNEQVPAGRNAGLEATFRFRLRTLLLATTALVLVTFGIRLGWQRAQENNLQSRIKNDLRQIWLGLSNHESSVGSLPSTASTSQKGAPLVSWRVRIMGYLESWSFKIPQSSWNAPENDSVRAMRLPYYCWDESSKNPATNVFAIAGDSAAFDDDNVRRLADLPANLVMLMEVADSNIHWMQPGDYDVTKLLAAPGRLGDNVKGLLNDRIHILFADGEVWAISPDAPIDAMKPFFTIGGAQVSSREVLLTPYRIDRPH